MRKFIIATIATAALVFGGLLAPQTADARPWGYARPYYGYNRGFYGPYNYGYRGYYNGYRPYYNYGYRYAAPYYYNYGYRYGAPYYYGYPGYRTGARVWVGPGVRVY